MTKEQLQISHSRSRLRLKGLASTSTYVSRSTWTSVTILCISILLMGPLLTNGNFSLLSTTALAFSPKNTTNSKINLELLIGEVDKLDHREVNSSIEYVYQFTFNASDDKDIRVNVNTESVDTLFPILFVVRQQKGVMSWSLPVKSKFDNKLYKVASRTLCGQTGPSGSNNIETIEKTIFVSVSTSSRANVSYNITVELEDHFIMRLNESSTVDVSPLSPRFYRFIFPASHSRFVLLEVTSPQKYCMTVSVQNASCPVLDQENNVQFEGYWQTMTTKAGMTLRKDDFPEGFYVVFVMHGDDTRCQKSDGEEYTTSSVWRNADRVKQVTFVVNEKITDTEYLAAIFGTVGIFLTFYVFSFIISCAYLWRSTPPEFPLEDEAEASNHNHPHHHNEHARILASEGEDNPGTTRRHPRSINGDGGDDIDGLEGQHWLADSDSSLDETDIDMLADANREKDVYRTTTSLCVAALARKNPMILAKKSQLYLWTLFTVAVFYALPVVQLVFTYQKVLHTTGNQDLCYYNYLCSHPLWLLSDFNHVYSNIGYIMLGVLFLLLVLRKERMHAKLACQHPNVELRCGIPRHFGLFYAMGFALIMEGVLSACYHVCPNHSNFQFDTCFMYVNAMLLMLKIYQTRHPDINASAYMSFAALAVVVLLGVLGVLAGSLSFWICFTILHVSVCMYLSVTIYYLGRWRLDCGIFQRIYHTWKNDCIASPLLCLKPLYIDRMILLIIVNIANWTIAGFGIFRMSHDFASHLLLIFMGNLFLYSNFYIIMKVTHREKIMFQPLIYIILSVVFWCLSMYVFLHKSTSWQMTPAESRTYNRECLLLRFYDTHDIWHFLSAASMFFSFMILLTLDDDLIFTPRTKIPVF